MYSTEHETGFVPDEVWMILGTLFFIVFLCPTPKVFEDIFCKPINQKFWHYDCTGKNFELLFLHPGLEDQKHEHTVLGACDL